MANASEGADVQQCLRRCEGSGVVGLAEQRRTKTADTRKPVDGDEAFVEPGTVDTTQQSAPAPGGEAQESRSGTQFLFYRRLEVLDAKSQDRKSTRLNSSH